MAVAGTSAFGQNGAMFAKKASIVNIAEIRLGRMAQDRGISAEVREYGRMMVADHQMAQNQLGDIAKRLRISLPHELDAKHKALYRKLSMLNGRRFDEAYKAEMVKGHAKVLTMMRKEAKNGKVQALREYAMMQGAVVERHWEAAKAITVVNPR